MSEENPGLRVNVELLPALHEPADQLGFPRIRQIRRLHPPGRGFSPRAAKAIHLHASAQERFKHLLAPGCSTRRGEEPRLMPRLGFGRRLRRLTRLPCFVAHCARLDDLARLCPFPRIFSRIFIPLRIGRGLVQVRGHPIAQAKHYCRNDEQRCAKKP